MRIAVLGGSGVVGRHVVEVAHAGGHDAVACSRASGVDLVTGEGLDRALDGATAAVDVTNIPTVRRRPARRYFEATARNLQGACVRQGVRHVVVLSIVGIDRVRAFGYYDAKRTQEVLHLDGPVGATVLRATQFHEFPAQVVERGARGGAVVVPDLTVQTVAARAVAEVLVELAGSPEPMGQVADVGGPGPSAQLPALVTAALAHEGRRLRVVPVPLVGPARTAVRDGALLPAADARLVGPTFEAWLAA